VAPSPPSPADESEQVWYLVFETAINYQLPVTTYQLLISR
jgi:hypothetical protein